uniref:Uncharacterized protein n=1 Tax=Anguilla anguilla TaxID=7936 RepID=A0A0E9PFF4_ANGAN
MTPSRLYCFELRKRQTPRGRLRRGGDLSVCLRHNSPRSGRTSLRNQTTLRKRW